MRWTEEHIKELSEKYFYYLKHKKEAEEHFKRRWNNITLKASQLKITSIKINKSCSAFLGCHVAERVLSHVFKDVHRMLFTNPGYDFICNKGFKIDVKSTILNKNNSYMFTINRNKIANYFLLIGFDDRKKLNPQHIWLIKSNEITMNYRKLKSNKKLNDHRKLLIVNDNKHLTMFSKYELTDKLKETIECCNKLKGEDK